MLFKDRNEYHYCNDWDFMLVKPGDIEMEACLCFMRAGVE